MSINIYALFACTVSGAIGFGMLAFEIIHYIKFKEFFHGSYTPPKNIIPPPLPLYKAIIVNPKFSAKIKIIE